MDMDHENKQGGKATTAAKPASARSGGHGGMASKDHGGMYGRFGLMLALSFVAMFILMYAMVDRAGNALPNVNQAYMAALMTAPMAVLEMALMGAMYPDAKRNRIILVAGVVVGLLSWFAIRQQVAIGDRQFLRSMIPHHAGALLMCRQAKLSDPEVVALCQGIEASQTSEIAQMKALLAR